MKSALIQKGSQKIHFAAPVLPNVSDELLSHHVRQRSRTSIEEVEQAKKEARELGMQEGLKAGLEKGFQEGLEKGIKDGTQKAFEENLRLAAEERRAKITQFSADLSAVVSKLQTEIPLWYERSEEQMANLITMAVERLLAAEISHSRDFVIALVKEALLEVTHSRHARIRLNPFDSALVQEHRAEILAVAGSLRDVEFVDDASIAGGCVIETDGGLIDSTLETRLGLFTEEMEKAA